MARTVKGIIDRDGSVISGEGFSAKSWGGSGIFVIEYQEPFREPPVFVCSIAGSEWETYNLSASIVDNLPFATVVSTSSPDRPVNSSFHFIAMGD